MTRHIFALLIFLGVTALDAFPSDDSPSDEMQKYREITRGRYDKLKDSFISIGPNVSCEGLVKTNDYFFSSPVSRMVLVSGVQSNAMFSVVPPKTKDGLLSAFSLFFCMQADAQASEFTLIRILGGELGEKSIDIRVRSGVLELVDEKGRPIESVDWCYKKELLEKGTLWNMITLCYSDNGIRLDCCGVAVAYIDRETVYSILSSKVCRLEIGSTCFRGMISELKLVPFFLSEFDSASVFSAVRASMLRE